MLNALRKPRDASYWRSRLAGLEAKEAELRAAHREAVDRRADWAVDDGPEAEAHMRKAGEDCRKLGVDLEDLGIQLAGARQRLAEAEAAEASSADEARRKRFDRIMAGRQRDVEEMTRLAGHLAEVQGRLNASWAEAKTLCPRSLGGNDSYGPRGGAAFLTRLALCKAGLNWLFSVGRSTVESWPEAVAYEAGAQAAARLHGWGEDERGEAA